MIFIIFYIFIHFFFKNELNISLNYIILIKFIYFKYWGLGPNPNPHPQYLKYIF